MKTRLVIAALLIVLLQFGCKREETQIQPESVTYLTINKTLTGVSLDTVNSLGCTPVYFAIVTSADSATADSLQAQITFAPGWCGDCGIYFLTTSSTGNLAVYSENETISADDNWTPISAALSLADFKGAGEKYIAFECSSFAHINQPFSHFEYHHGLGWIRVQLSADGKSLQIIDMALNNINGQSILAGQTK
jgi:hypothetical protein